MFKYRSSSKKEILKTLTNQIINNPNNVQNIFLFQEDLFAKTKAAQKLITPYPMQE
nr:hypothetical protein [Ferruginibacter albus]